MSFNFDRSGSPKPSKNYRERSVNTSRVSKSVPFYKHPIIAGLFKFVLPVVLFSFLSGGFVAVLATNEQKRDQFIAALEVYDFKAAWRTIATERDQEVAYYFTGEHPHLKKLSEETKNPFWVEGFANVASPAIGNIAITKELIQKYQYDKDQEECFENKNGQLTIKKSCKVPAVGMTPDDATEFCAKYFTVKINGKEYKGRIPTETEMNNIFSAPVARKHIKTSLQYAELTSTLHPEDSDFHKLYFKKSPARQSLLKLSEAHPGYIKNNAGTGLTSVTTRCVIPIVNR